MATLLHTYCTGKQINKQKLAILSANNDEEQLKCSNAAGENVIQCSHFRKHNFLWSYIWHFPYDPLILPLGPYLREIKIMFTSKSVWLFIITQLKRKPKYPSAEERITNCEM